jgi:hypothetical protein
LLARFGRTGLHSRNLIRRPCDAVDQAEQVRAEGKPPISERLDSRKETAAFLGRGVRTVQRWSTEKGCHERGGSSRARELVHRRELLTDLRGSIVI